MQYNYKKPIASLDGEEIFAHLPPTRCGIRVRELTDEVLDDGFGNK